jgi:hypothetical protein
MQIIYKNSLCILPEGKRPLDRPRHRQENNIKMDLRKIRLESVEWIHLGQYQDQWSCEHGNESSSSIKDSEFLYWEYYQFLNADYAPLSELVAMTLYLINHLLSDHPP